MDLEQLKALVAVVEARSISRAARQMRASQPAISLRLKALEQHLGVPLLIRNYDGITPTAHGDLVAETARRVLELCDTMTSAVQTSQGQVDLQIGATPTLGGFVIPHLLSRFRELFPQVRLGLSVSHLTSIVRRVEDGQLALGFIEDVYDGNDLASEEVGADELKLIMAYDRDKPDEVTEPTALNFPQVLCVQECGMRQVLERYLGKRGRSTQDLAVVAEMDSLDAVKALVEGGAGVAWLAPRTVVREVQAGSLQVVPVYGIHIPYNYVALYRKDRGRTPEMSRFIALVRERLRPHRRRSPALAASSYL